MDELIAHNDDFLLGRCGWIDMDSAIDNGIEWMLIITLLWDTSIMLVHDWNEMNQLKWDEKWNEMS